MVKTKRNAKRSPQKSPAQSAAKRSKTINLGWDDPDIESSDDENDKDHHLHEEEEPPLEEETLDAKKIRLARQYLQTLEDAESSSSSSSDSSDDEEEEKDKIGYKLQKDRLRAQGAWHHPVADRLARHVESLEASNNIHYFRGHDLSPTCVSLFHNGTLAASGSKDHSVLLWNVETQQRHATLSPSYKKQKKKKTDSSASRTQGQVLSVAGSDDGRYLAVGARDATVRIYDVRLAGQGNSCITTFTGHKGAVTALAFRTQSLQLFSGSDDRCIRHYNLEEMMYLETLYGHQFGVTALDCHQQERPVSVGRDRTARVWKLAEDSHLIFRSGPQVASADCISMIHNDWFVTGHDDGTVALWKTDKKKAVASQTLAHGYSANSTVGAGIASVHALRASDVVVTGSHDGYLRFWKVRTGKTLDERGMEALTKIPLKGYVNGVAIGPKGRFCVAAVGQEPRLGRWNRVRQAKNRFAIVQLGSQESLTSDDSNSGSEESDEEETKS